MRQIEVLVEEPSAEAALRNLLPKLIDGRAQFKIINFGSKYKLIQRLPDRLGAYRRRVDKGEDLKIMILVDRDSEKCDKLKEKLEYFAQTAGLSTKTAPASDGAFVVVNRIVVEELEAWFLGDPAALRAAFTKLPPVSPRSNLFRNPDNGGTWEALHRYLRKNGVYRDAYPKIDAARKISVKMQPAANTSQSFQAFCRGLEAVLP